MNSNINYKIKKNVIIRLICNVLAFCMLVLAYLGFSWGEYLSPVQKSGVAVSFVFDISNSMLAKDCPQNTSRIEAAAIYAKKLLQHIGSTSVSVVLAKGDGVLAIPLTEDYAQVESLLDALSPSLMTVPGSSLGNGILVAKNSFPQNFSQAGRVFVFTDGEETDNQLAFALEECVKFGVPVSIIGFGKETESELLLPDNVTKVKTALRSENIINAIKNIEKNKKNKNEKKLFYVNSNQKGSAATLISQIDGKSKGNEKVFSYETKPIPRYKLFIFFGIVFFCLGYVLTELDMKKFFKKSKSTKNLKGINSSLIFLICFLFIGCNSDTFNILEGTVAWHKKDYKVSVAKYKNVVDNEESKNEHSKEFALYNLGVSYSMLNEKKSALEKYSQITEKSPKNVQYGAYYNTGVIHFLNADYDLATESFKKAIQIDNTKIEAKINMELSIKKYQTEVKQAQSEAIPAAEAKEKLPEMEDALFEHIKEQDKKQWKNSEQNQDIDYSQDY